jgi:hypothetical protein
VTRVSGRGFVAAAAQPDTADEVESTWQELKFAHCRRSHGITNYPDPLPGGGFRITFDTNTPQFEAAKNACTATLRK